jgi:hypothetical protein
VLYKPIGEVQTCLILANRAIIGRILSTNRNKGFYGLFPRAGTNPGENRSLQGLISIDLSTCDIGEVTPHFSGNPEKLLKPALECLLPGLDAEILHGFLHTFF